MGRRTATTEFLKECIADALLRLMREKDFDSISITEITELADVGRVTYYRNFKSKEDILLFKLKLLTKEWQQQEETKMETEPLRNMVAFFKFIDSIKDTILLLYHSKLMYVFQDYFYEIIGPKEDEKQEDAYLKAFASYGMFGLINEWIRGGMRETPQQLGEIFKDKLANVS